MGGQSGGFFSRNECRASFTCRSVWGRAGRGGRMSEIGILLRGANEAFRRSARRGSGFLACAALRARTSGRLLRRTAARILSAKTKSAPRIAGWRNLPAPGSIPAGRAFRLPGLMKACRWAGCCRRREKKEAEASEAARRVADSMRLSALSVFVLFFVFFVLVLCSSFLAFFGGARAVLSRAREVSRLKAHQESL